MVTIFLGQKVNEKLLRGKKYQFDALIIQKLKFSHAPNHHKQNSKEKRKLIQR
jgi:hypothetical protein